MELLYLLSRYDADRRRRRGETRRKLQKQLERHNLMHYLRSFGL